MRVALIGAGGFVGSGVRRVLEKEFELVSLTHKDFTKDHIGYFDVVINANGSSDKRLAEKDPPEDLRRNVCSVVDFMKKLDYSLFVHISSVEVYPEKRKESTSEEQLIFLEQLSQYGASKYLSELIVRRYTRRWLILRLAGMVGENMWKGPIYDIFYLKKLFLSSRSHLPFIRTYSVGTVISCLIKKGVVNEVVNVAARDPVVLGEVAKRYGIQLNSEGEKIVKLEVSTEKLKRLCDMEFSTWDEVDTFVGEISEGFTGKG